MATNDTTGNPYTIPTGPGFEGVYEAARAGVCVNTTTIDAVDVEFGDPVWYADVPVGAIVTDTKPALDDDRLIESQVTRSDQTPSLSLTQQVYALLGIDLGDEFRVYSRREAPGLLVVPRARDPLDPSRDDEQDRRLYYSPSEPDSNDRALHLDPECAMLTHQAEARDCYVGRPPRGHLCPTCAPGLVLADLHADNSPRHP